MVDFNAFAVRAGQECKSIRTLVNGNAANLNGLTTSNKSTLVAAINEVRAGVASAVGINDAVTSTTSTWSSSKIASYGGGGGGSQIDDTGVGTSTVWSSSKTNDSINAVIGTAPSGLNTLAKIATALGNDANYATTTTTALGNRVRADAAQSFNTTQQTQARSNIGAAGSTDMGDPATNFVSMFEAAML